jgi:23S rRNA (guanosine2251-2'-O)-methyltransferase
MMIKLNAKELRTQEPDLEEYSKIPKHDITIIVDTVLDTYNVGSIFRLADALAVKKVYLCGQTLTPPNSRIKKASINTWQWVSWEYKTNAVDAIESIKKEQPNTKIIAVEQDEKSIPLAQTHFELPCAIIVGNETYGISRDVLSLCDTIVELPMWGVNKSLNVMVSCGIVLYEIMRQVKQ